MSLDLATRHRGGPGPLQREVRQPVRIQSNRSPLRYADSTFAQAFTDRRGGALKYRPMRAIGRLHSGHGKGRSGTLLSQFDEPGCLNDLRQTKQAKWTLLVADGTPDPGRLPATGHLRRTPPNDPAHLPGPLGEL